MTVNRKYTYYGEEQSYFFAEIPAMELITLPHIMDERRAKIERDWVENFFKHRQNSGTLALFNDYPSFKPAEKRNEPQLLQFDF